MQHLWWFSFCHKIHADLKMIKLSVNHCLSTCDSDTSFLCIQAMSFLSQWVVISIRGSSLAIRTRASCSVSRPTLACVIGDETQRLRFTRLDKHTKIYGKSPWSPCLMAKSTISVAIFNSYVTVYQRFTYPLLLLSSTMPWSSHKNIEIQRHFDPSNLVPSPLLVKVSPSKWEWGGLKTCVWRSIYIYINSIYTYIYNHLKSSTHA